MVAAIDIVVLRYRWPGQPTPCLDIPRLEIAAGERVFLHGPSGGSKSTLLNLMAAWPYPSAAASNCSGGISSPSPPDASNGSATSPRHAY